MGFSIEQFKGRFKNDFAKSALFEVFFGSYPDLRFQAVSAVLPGSSIGTDVFSNGPYRPVERQLLEDIHLHHLRFCWIMRVDVYQH